jgi:hypothetical protein
MTKGSIVYLLSVFLATTLSISCDAAPKLSEAEAMK